MKRTGLLAAIVAGSLFMIGAAGCETSRPYGLYGNVGYYDYNYYPDAEVYYEPSLNVYYWHEGNQWHHGHDLPRTVVINRQQQVNVRLHTDRPYTVHAQVRSEHPGNHH